LKDTLFQSGMSSGSIRIHLENLQSDMSAGISNGKN